MNVSAPGCWDSRHADDDDIPTVNDLYARPRQGWWPVDDTEFMLEVVLMPDRMAPTPESDAQDRRDAKVRESEAFERDQERMWLGSQEQSDGRREWFPG